MVGWAAGLYFVSAALVLPVAEVREVADMRTSVYPGRVKAIGPVDIIPQVSGEILETCFKDGSFVKEGDVLFRIDPVKYEAAVKNAESKLAECKANVKYAELSYERHKTLLETRAVSLDAVDNALSQRDSSRAALAAAQAELVSAKDDLAHCTIVAPISGKVGKKSKARGNYIRAGSLSLLKIVSLTQMRVRFSVSNREMLDLVGGEGRRRPDDVLVRVTLANGTELGVDGKIEFVDNVADDLTDTIMVYARFDNPDYKLVPEGTVTVTLSSKKGVMRPAIPPTAVLQDTQGPYVWVLDKDNVCERRAIARGDLNGDWLFVEKGLKVGERIVADGAHKAKRGMKLP